MSVIKTLSLCSSDVQGYQFCGKLFDVTDERAANKCLLQLNEDLLYVSYVVSV